MPKIIFMLISMALLSNCATMQQTATNEERGVQTRLEWLNEKSREYDEIKPNKIFEAIEKIFELADKNDTKIHHSEKDMTAVRWAAPFPINVQYHWKVTAEEDASRTKVFTDIGFSTITAYSIGGATPHDSVDVLRLFYHRLDYMLGKAQKWLSCDDYIKLNPIRTSLEALCLHANDLDPSRLTN